METPETISQMLDGSRRERRELAERIFEHVDRAVHYALRAGRFPAELREDRVSEIMLYLYRDGAKVLRRWDPNRAGLRGYLNMIAGRHVFRQRAGGPAMASLIDEDTAYLPGATLDDELAYRVGLEELYDWVRHHGSAKDRRRFDALLVEGCSVTEMAEREGGTADAIYTWMSRFKRRIKEAMPHVLDLLERRN